MSDRVDMKSYILKSILLVLAYVLAAKLGLIFATTSVGATTIWPSGGIALAALLLGGVRYLPAVFVGAALTAAMVQAPLIFGIGSTIGNTLETYLAYQLISRLAGLEHIRLEKVSSLFLIVGLGAIIPSAVSAVLGPVSLYIANVIPAEQLGVAMLRWWRGDVLGIALLTPAVLVFARSRPFFRDAARFWEVFVLWVFAVVMGQMVFLGWNPFALMAEPLQVAWIIPAILWAGNRTGRRNTALIQLLFVVQALASSQLKIGFFADEFMTYGLSNFWMLAMMLAVVGMSFAILSTVQRHAARTIAQHAWVFEVSHDGVLITDADNNIVSVNAAFTTITGYSADEVQGKNPRILASGRHERAFYEQMWKSINETGYWTGEVWNRRKDGSVYLEQISIHCITDARGKVTSRLGIFSDITAKKANEHAITHQAQHDFLTKLPNRLLFCDRFSQQLAAAKRHGDKFALIYLDLDGFKPVNDQLGHAVGDELLIAVASRLKAAVREVDTVSRFGGDEFAVLVSDVESIDDAVMMATKVLATLNKPFHIGVHQVQISASLGIAMYPENGLDMEAILQNADEAMYQAKHNGHNQYVVA